MKRTQFDQTLNGPRQLGARLRARPQRPAKAPRSRNVDQRRVVRSGIDLAHVNRCQSRSSAGSGCGPHGPGLGDCDGCSPNIIAAARSLIRADENGVEAGIATRHGEASEPDIVPARPRKCSTSQIIEIILRWSVDAPDRHGSIKRTGRACNRSGETLQTRRPSHELSGRTGIKMARALRGEGRALIETAMPASILGSSRQRPLSASHLIVDAGFVETEDGKSRYRAAG